MMKYGRTLQGLVCILILMNPLKEIGRGGFATVYCGELNGAMYAMKKFHSDKLVWFQKEKGFARLKNPRIVTPVGWSTKTSNEKFLLFP